MDEGKRRGREAMGENKCGKYSREIHALQERGKEGYKAEFGGWREREREREREIERLRETEQTNKDRQMQIIRQDKKNKIPAV